VKLIKTQVQPGNNAIALIQSIGAQLAQINNSFIDALGVSFTGATITSQTGSFVSMLSEILNVSIGTVDNLSIQSMDVTITAGNTGYINDLSSDTFTVNNLNTETFISGTGYLSNLITNSITGSSAYFSAITGAHIFSPQLSTTEMTGSSAFFTSFTGVNVYSGTFSSITGVYNSLYSQTGHFTTLIADSVLFNSSQSTKNYLVTDTITGSNIYIQGALSGNMTYCQSITGSTINFTSLTGTNIYTQNVSIPVVTGGSLFSTSITGVNICASSQISSTNFSGTNIYATSGFFATITGSSDIYASSKISASEITGNIAFATSQVSSKNLTSDIITQYTSGEELVVSGVGILNSTVLDLRRLWTTSILATRAVTTWITKTTPDTSGLGKIAWSTELGYFVSPYLTGGQNLATSSDGSNWTSLTVSSIYPNTWQGICYSSEKEQFVIASNGGNYRFLYNSDSTLANWTIVTDPLSSPSLSTSNTVYSPEQGNFYAVVQSKGTLSSSDGQNWTTYNIPIITGLPLGILIWNSELELFCYVGNGFSITSPDIVNWTASTNPPVGNCYGGTWSAELGLFCSVGDNGLIQTSSDGLTWTTQTSPVGNVTWQDIAWSSDLYIFVCLGSTPGGGSNTQYVYSVDGITWTSGTSPMSIWDGYGICWAKELGIFVATGKGDESTMVSTYVKKCYQ